MKNIKKTLSVILALLMIISIIPMSSITASAETTSGTCGANLIWTYDDSTGTLTISGTGAMADYSGDYLAPWFGWSVKSLIINNGVTTIGDYAFSGKAITSITIPDSVTTIGDEAFFACYFLASVTIPDSVKTIGYRAFCNCDSLTSIMLPDSVTTIGDEAFYLCNNLKSVTIGNSVTSIGAGAFANCKSLENVVIPDSVTTIGNLVFYLCTSLTSVTIPDSVTSIGESAFENCESLTSVIIPGRVTTIGDSAFSECTSLTSVTIPDSVSSIGEEAFRNCTSLASVTFGKGLKTIGDGAFLNCTSLEELNISDISSWCNISFDGITSNPLYYTGVLKLNGKVVTDFVIPDGTERINDYAFCNSHIRVTIPNSVTSIGYGAFEYCTSLTSVTIPDSVTSIGESAFYGCTSLTDVYYSGTEEEWNSIFIGPYNTYLTNATIHYNSLGEHLHCYLVTVVPPTCTTQGYTLYSCDCGETYTDNYVEAGHSITTVVTPATCTESGMSCDICEICGETFGTSIVIPATGHTYENGFCTVCGEKDPSYTEEPEYNYTFSIQQPSRTEIRNKDSIILHAKVEGNAPVGSYVRWESSNGNFDKSADGSNLKIIANNKGWTTFTAILCDADGNELARDTVDMYSKSGFFDKIGGFFRSLFGTTKVYDA